MNTDPLADIFTSDSDVDPSVLADILRTYLKIGLESNIIFYTDAGLNLSLNDKLTLFFVARKALKYKSKIDEEEISPSDIIKQTSFKEGSVHPTLKKLREDGWIMTRNGKYFLPNHQLNKIRVHFSKKTE